jgi:hypothetical protein
MAVSGQYIPTDAVAVTPHDTNGNVFSGFYIGGAGNFTVVTEAGNTTTFTSVPAGSQIILRTQLVKSTGTTATSIVGFR